MAVAGTADYQHSYSYQLSLLITFQIYLGKGAIMKTNSRFRRFLSMLMVLAMMMQYGISLEVFAEDGVESLEAAAAKEAKAAAAEEKAAEEKAAAEKAAA